MSSNTEIIHQQNELLNLIRKEPSHRNYWYVYKQIKKLNFSNEDIPSNFGVNIAFLSSFTIDPLVTYIDVDCRLEGLFPQIYIAPFNRFNEEVYNINSGLYQFKSDIIIFMVELESLFDNMFKINFPKIELSQKMAELDRIIQDIEQLLVRLTQNTKSLIIFSNFVVPTFTALGILDNKQDLGFKRFYQILNERLERIFQNNNQIFILDLNEVASRFGKDNYVNYQMYYRGDFLYSDPFLPYVSYEIMGYIKAFKARNRKCIVLDLDNTLWGGIIGEDGLEGIKLNPNYPGNVFFDFQRTILILYNRGIILAVNSKNNKNDVLEVFQKHPYMLIKEENLADYRINWEDKVKNLIDLAKSLNIGLDSMIFVDDNPTERARVQFSLPEVKVIEMPSNPALFKQTLEQLNDFNTLSLTKEDFNRSEMYFARRKRQILEQEIQSIDEFIKTLEIIAEIKQIDEFSLPRVVSLLNRTNQFNLTTKRYSEIEIREMVEKPNKFAIYTLKVSDKFGDEGIVGVAIIKIESETNWFIDSFLMSCRVIGRKIETAFLYKILKDAQYHNVRRIDAEYRPTKKNVLVEHFYSQHGFILQETKDDGSFLWFYEPLDNEIIYPEYLQVVEK